MGSSSTIHRSAVLDANADTIWHAVTSPTAFRLVTRGLLRWLGVARSRVAPWSEGETHSGLLLAFGFLPVTRHTITLERIDAERRELQSDEHGGVVRSWRHLIRVTPVDQHSCLYEDIVEIDAGLLTPAVVAFARWFYGVRQRRWQELAHVMT